MKYFCFLAWIVITLIKSKDPLSHHFPTGIKSYLFTNLSPTLILDFCYYSM